MSGIIDLLSSDDENNEKQASTNENIPTPPAETLEKTTAVTESPHNLPELYTENNSTESVPENDITEASSSQKDTGAELPENSTQATILQSGQRARPRKSQHRALRISPEIEFQKLSPQKKVADGNKPNFARSNSLPKKKHFKKISILAQRPLTCEELLDIEFDKLLNDPTALNLIRDIAAERVRINQLLSNNGMPQIKFTLYTMPEMLEFQIKERFKQKDLFETK